VFTVRSSRCNETRRRRGGQHSEARRWCRCSAQFGRHAPVLVSAWTASDWAAETDDGRAPAPTPARPANDPTSCPTVVKGCNRDEMSCPSLTAIVDQPDQSGSALGGEHHLQRPVLAASPNTS
jgi:hypothetical protein